MISFSGPSVLQTRQLGHGGNEKHSAAVQTRRGEWFLSVGWLWGGGGGGGGVSLLSNFADVSEKWKSRFRETSSVREKGM